jgi:hypothetical protein
MMMISRKNIGLSGVRRRENSFSRPPTPLCASVRGNSFGVAPMHRAEGGEIA